MTALATILEILKCFVELARFIEQNKNDQWFKEATANLAAIREAKTPEEKARETSKFFHLLDKP